MARVPAWPRSAFPRSTLSRADSLDSLGRRGASFWDRPRLPGRSSGVVLTRPKILIDFLLRIPASPLRGVRARGIDGSLPGIELSASAVRNMVKAIGSDSTHDLAHLTDEELMSRYRDQGPEAVFTELVHRYERELFRYLARYLGDPSLADDVFQNTFLQIHLKRGLYEDGRPFRPWLYAIS